MEQKLRDAASKLPEAKLPFDEIRPAERTAPGLWRKAVCLAACVALLVIAGIGSYALAAENREYNDAVQFFDDHGLSTEGLNRDQIKAVYRDITTKTFSYSKTMDVLVNSLTTAQVGGFEILQENPSQEDIRNLWNRIDYAYGLGEPGPEGVRYQIDCRYEDDPVLGFSVVDVSCIEKYAGETHLWTAQIPDVAVIGCRAVSDGVVAYGFADTYAETKTTCWYVIKVDEDGYVQWTHRLDHGFENEYVAQVLENADGGYAVFSRGELKYFCLSQLSAEGVQTHFRMTEMGNYGIWNAACFGDGYIVQLGNDMVNEHARIVKVDRLGNITDDFSYSAPDAHYYIADMTEYNGRIWLSAYAVPKLADETENAGGRYEIAGVLNYLFDNDILEISSEELTPLVRDNYTAMLLVCDPGKGLPQEFFSVEGSLGGKLRVSEGEQLIWDVESITSTYFSPYTSSHTIGGTSYVFRYTFDDAGHLISQEKTDQTAPFWK